jgi:hypothetical protein
MARRRKNKIEETPIEDTSAEVGSEIAESETPAPEATSTESMAESPVEDPPKIVDETPLDNFDIVVENISAVEYNPLEELPLKIQQALASVTSASERVSILSHHIISKESLNSYREQFMDLLRSRGDQVRLRLNPIEAKMLEITGTRIPQIAKHLLRKEISFDDAMTFLDRERRALIHLVKAASIAVKGELLDTFWLVVKKILEEAAKWAPKLIAVL